MLLLVFEGSHNREDWDEGFVSFFKDGLFCGAHGEFLVYPKAQVVEVGDPFIQVKRSTLARVATHHLQYAVAIFFSNVWLAATLPYDQ